MRITRRFYETLRDDYDLQGITDDYSGRGMFGQLCFGFTCPPAEFYGALFDIVDQGNYDEELADEARDFFISQPTMCIDSLGLDHIYYFPYVKVEEAEDDEYAE